jgi:hypothetical protein
MRIFAKGMVADTIKLTAGGTDAIKISYRFNATAHWSEIMKLRLDLAKEAERKVQNYEVIGAKVIEMFNLVFGADCTKQIMDFFEGHLESMITNLTPVFQYKIYPACEKARKAAIKARKKSK